MMPVLNRWLEMTLSHWMALSAACLPLAAKAQNQWTQFTNFTSITSLAENRQALWVGTFGGLIRIDKATGAKSYFNQFNAVQSDYRIQHLDCDTAGRLGLITSKGALLEFDGMQWVNNNASPLFKGQHMLDLAWGLSGTLYALAIDSATGLPHFFTRNSGQWMRFSLAGVGRVNAEGNSVQGLTHRGVFSAYGSIIPHLQVDENGRALVLTGHMSRLKLFRIDTAGTIDTLPIPSHLNPRLYIQPKSGAPYWLCQSSLAKPAGEGWDTIPLPKEFDFYAQVKTHPRHLFTRLNDGSEFWSFNRLYKFREGIWNEESIPGDYYRTLPLQLLSTFKPDSLTTGTQLLYAARGDWVGTLEGPIWSISDISRKPLGASSEQFWTTLPLRSRVGEILLARETGIQLLDAQSSKSTPITLGNTAGTPQPAIVGVSETPDGKIWLRTTTGLIQYDLSVRQAPAISKMGLENLSYSLSNSEYFTTDTAGTLWAAAKGRLIAIPGGSTDSSTWKSHWLPGPRDKEANLFSLSAHPDGSIWFATYVGSNPDEPEMTQIGHYDGQNWSMRNASQHPWLGGPSKPSIQCVRDGNVWIRFAEGLLQWDGMAWKEHALASSPFFQHGIQAMTSDPQGRLWIASNQPDAKLFRWEGNWVPVTELRGNMGTSQITSMRFDATGKLWLSTRFDGVFAFESNGGSTTFTPSIQLSPKVHGRLQKIRSSQARWQFQNRSLQKAGIPFIDLRGRKMRSFQGE